MNPYYSDGMRSIYHCDFRAAGALINGCDCIVADPPYGETALEWDRWPKGWPSALLEMAKPTASMWCFGSLKMFWRNHSEFEGWSLDQDLVWGKQNGTGLNNDRFRKVHESVLFFIRTGIASSDVYRKAVYVQSALQKTIRRKTKLGHWSKIRSGYYESIDGGPSLELSVLFEPNCHGKALNETQKPLGIVSPMVKYACPPGGMIASIFMGSGTDLVIAKDLGIRAVGFDLRESQCEVAARRLSGMLDLAGAV